MPTLQADRRTLAERRPTEDAYACFGLSTVRVVLLMLPGWYREWPDATTDAILRIDAELAKTQALRNMINRDALCVVCGEHGLHTHWGT